MLLGARRSPWQRSSKLREQDAQANTPHEKRTFLASRALSSLGWHNPLTERCWTKIVPVQAWEVNPLMPCNRPEMSFSVTP